MSSPPSSNSRASSPASPIASKDQSPSSDKEDSQGAQEGVEEASDSADAPRSGPPSAGPTPAGPAPSSTSATTPSSGNWQAIWSPMHNAYYFYNAVTHETTWVNPLQPVAGSSESTTSTSTNSTTTATPDPSAPSASTSTSSAPAPSAPDSNPQEEGGSSASSSSGATPVPASVAQIYALQEAAVAQGIDPSLAHLDPSLAGPSAPGAAYNYSARFNAHTGTFTRPDGRDPTHLSEYERMKRMSSVYFNMEQWEQEVAQRKQQEDEDAENGKKRKRPTKKDLVRCSLSPQVCTGSPSGTLIVFLLQERFKEQKRLKKIAKTAWLRT